MDDTDGTWWLDYEPLEPNYDREHWTTRDGVRLEIKEMETSHIKNTINLLKRNLEKLDEDERDYYSAYFDFKINEFEKELKIRDVYKKHILEED